MKKTDRLLAVLLFSFFTSQMINSQSLQFKDLLNIKNTPKSAKDRDSFFMSDCGAWFGFALPSVDAANNHSSFAGPFMIERGEWFAKKFMQLEIRVKEKVISYPRNKKEIQLLPGRLYENYSGSNLEIKSELFFANSNSAIIRTVIQNTGSEIQLLYLKWNNELFTQPVSIAHTCNSIEATIPLSGDRLRINLPREISITYDYNAERNALEIYSLKSISIKPMGSFKIDITVSLLNEGTELPKPIDKDISYKQNKTRWDNYKRIIATAGSQYTKDDDYQRIAMKCLITLINNWRSPKGDLLHDGLFPSTAVSYFNGFWAWDSWKHSAALSRFDSKLAENQILAMFDYQTSEGMVPDVIYADKKENNLRDTKPPLASWAVWEIYKQTGDKKFLEVIYPKLRRYHEWWYKNRDHDLNGLCEYGSTDGTLIAAAWESGMDNAVRFDSTKMIRNNGHAWSMNQESVDLNSYLYAEKNFLGLIAATLNRKSESENYLRESILLKEKISRKMFDDETGYFYDIDLNSKRHLKIQGPEGWIPLWANAASREQALSVLKIISDPAKFSTFIPFPTVAKDNQKYSTDYWRGPVWLDQVYFAVEGLRNYHFIEEANKYTRQIFDRLKGLKNSDSPIYENYNAITGDGLNARHFSWSAAHLLLLYLAK